MQQFIIDHWGVLTSILFFVYQCVSAFVATAPDHYPATGDDRYKWLIAGLRQFFNARRSQTLPPPPYPQSPLSPGQFRE